MKKPRADALPEPIKVGAIERLYLTALDLSPPARLGATRQATLDTAVEAWLEDGCPELPEPERDLALPAGKARLSRADLLIYGHPAGVIRNTAEARRLDAIRTNAPGGTDGRRSWILDTVRALILWYASRSRVHSRSGPSPT